MTDPFRDELDRITSSVTPSQRHLEHILNLAHAQEQTARPRWQLHLTQLRTPIVGAVTLAVVAALSIGVLNFLHGQPNVIDEAASSLPADCEAKLAPAPSSVPSTPSAAGGTSSGPSDTSANFTLTIPDAYVAALTSNSRDAVLCIESIGQGGRLREETIHSVRQLSTDVDSVRTRNVLTRVYRVKDYYYYLVMGNSPDLRPDAAGDFTSFYVVSRPGSVLIRTRAGDYWASAVKSSVPLKTLTVTLFAADGARRDVVLRQFG